MLNFQVKVSDGKAAVYTPYNKAFVEKVKLLGGRWNAAGKCWTVDAGAVEDVRSAMREVYGRDDSPVAETVDVELSFSEEVCAPRGSVAILGRTIASAFGRDTGASVGDGVLFLEGKPTSGGSMKNWYTVVPAGSVVKLLQLPSRDWAAVDLPRGVSLRVLGTSVDRDALAAEKERLMARLVEIDRLLAAV